MKEQLFILSIVPLLYLCSDIPLFLVFFVSVVHHRTVLFRGEVAAKIRIKWESHKENAQFLTIEHKKAFLLPVKRFFKVTSERLRFFFIGNLETNNGFSGRTQSSLSNKI